MPSYRSNVLSRVAGGLAGALAMVSSAGFAQAQSVLGVWIDHTGRGAVEITECGGAVCGKIVWVKDPKHAKTCGNPVLGNVRPVGSNTWDRGWIIDPDDNARYSVELKPIGNDRLRVVGYMGSKLFSETMTWKRAPADLVLCDGRGGAQQARAEPNSVPAPVPSAAPAPAAGPITPAGPPAPATADAPAAAPATVPAAGIAKAPVTVLPPAPQAAKPNVSVIPPEENPPPRTAVAPVTAPAPGVAEEPGTAPAAEAKPAPSSRPRVAAAPADPGEPPAPRKRKAKTCKLDLPYVTLNYPCDAF